MASRLRQSGVSSSAVGRQPVPVELPPYEAPVFPLNNDAQMRLETLLRQHNLTKLRKHFTNATDQVTGSAGLINDQLSDMEDSFRRRQAKRTQNSQGTGEASQQENDEHERALEEMRVKVVEMTRRMEENMRSLIDGQTYVAHLENNIGGLRQQTLSSQATTTQASTQRRNRRAPGAGADSDEEMDDADFDPTLPGASGRPEPALQGPKNILEQRMARDKTAWQTLNRRSRYADHNDYVGYRRVVWDAQHPGEEAPPLPHASTWFTVRGSPDPGTSRDVQASQTGGAQDDSDDDIAIAREKISTKCPLTLREFENPVTSKKCPHSFEKDAIMSMIRNSASRIGGSNRRGASDGERTVQCPVPGCSVMMTAADLAPDPFLIRKIRRIQQARAQGSRSPSPDSNRHGRRNAHEILSSDIDDIDALERSAAARARSVHPKQERLSGIAR